MQTGTVKEIEKRGNDAVKRLRESKHSKGLPFMINSKNLPGNECYLEYPDGRIMLVTLKSPRDRDFTVIRELSSPEKNNIIKRFSVS